MIESSRKLNSKYIVKNEDNVKTKKKVMQYKLKNRTGSAVLVVIIAGSIMYTYIMSTYSDISHFSILQKKYENNIKELYEQEVENIEDVYDQIYRHYNSK